MRIPQDDVFAAFQENIDAARDLVRGGIALEQLRVAALNVGDVFRGALVQSVSALDTWVGDETSRRAAALAQSAPTALPIKLRKVKITLGQAEAIVRGELSLGEVASDAVVTELKPSTNTLQRPKKIADALEYVWDGELWPAVTEWLRDHAPGFEHVSTSSLTARLNDIIDRRNQIAHGADRVGDGKAKRPIDGAETEAMIESIWWIVRGINAVLGELVEADPALDDELSRVRRPSSVALIAAAGAIEDGEELYFWPSAVFEGQFAEWISENPDRGKATWIADGGVKVLRWAADGAPYSTSGLVAELFNQAGIEGFPAYNGPTWWGVGDRGTLAEIAEEIYRSETAKK